MTCLLLGPTRWEGSRDVEGYRTWKITYRIACDASDGPANALQTPGLPLIGSYWIINDDFDNWAWCRPDATIVPVTDVSRNNFFLVTMTFSNKPPDKDKQRCNTTQIEDPLLEPPKIQGSFSRYTEEATYDRFGDPILSSAWEPIRGPTVEFDKNRAGIKIQMNVLNLDLSTLALAADTVNMFPMWGCPYRSIKLSDPTWEKKYYGTCFVYFSVNLNFEVRIKEDPVTGERVSGWDKDVTDEGTKVLSGHWGTEGVDGTIHWVIDRIGGPAGPFADPSNPSHFIRFPDRRGDNSRVVLNGYGLPFDPYNKTTPTSSAAGIGAPGVVVVTPAAMETYIKPGAVLVINIGLFDEEAVVVTAVGAGTFTASFAFAHDPGFTITDAIAGISKPGSIHIEKYDETDFPVVLGVPSSLTTP